MAVTLATLQTETRVRYGESSAATNGIFTDAFVLSVVNEFYDEREVDLELELNPFTYTLAAAATSVALSTLNTSVISITKIEVLDSAGDVEGEVKPRPQGDARGYFVRNSIVYFNGDGSATSQDLKVYGYRKATRHTATSENADVHSGSERSVLIPLLLSKGYERAKKFAIADGYRIKHERAFDRMLKKKDRQASQEYPTAGANEDYEPLTG